MPNLYSVKTLPSKGKELGDIYFCNATKETFVVLGSLQLFNMAGLLSGNPVAVVGPPGEKGLRGPAGADAVGIQGERGTDGRSCTCTNRGEPGPAGPQGVPGPRGEKGEPGSVVFPTDSEVAAALVELRKEYAMTQAALLREISNSKNLKASTRLHVLGTLNRIKKTAGL